MYASGQNNLACIFYCKFFALYFILLVIKHFELGCKNLFLKCGDMNKGDIMKIQNIVLIALFGLSAYCMHAWPFAKTQAYTNEIVAVQQQQNGNEMVVTFAFTQDPICTYTPHARDVNSIKRYSMPYVEPINDFILRALGKIHSQWFDMTVTQSQGELFGLDLVFTLAQGVSVRKVVDHSTYNVHFIFTRV